MLYKKRKIIIAIIVCIIFAGWCIGVYDVNKRLPNPEYIVYTKSNPANINGLTIIPVSNQIYTDYEFQEIYADCYEEHYQEYNNTEDDRFIVYELEVTNTTDDSIWFEAVVMSAFDKKTCFANGCTEVSGNISPIIKKGETITLKMVSYIYADRITEAQRKNLKKEDFGLTLAYYPEYITLQFD